MLYFNLLFPPFLFFRFGSVYEYISSHLTSHIQVQGTLRCSPGTAKWLLRRCGYLWAHSSVKLGLLVRNVLMIDAVIASWNLARVGRPWAGLSSKEAVRHLPLLRRRVGTIAGVPPATAIILIEFSNITN